MHLTEMFFGSRTLKKNGNSGRSGNPDRANNTIKLLNNASKLCMLKHRADVYLREHGIDPEKSSMTILQQAQLLDSALKALDSLGGANLQEFMCSDNFKDKTDQKIGGYTFRGIKNDETKRHELYVWKTDASEKFILIHSSDSCEVGTNLNRRVGNILRPYNIAHNQRVAQANLERAHKKTRNNARASNNALVKSTMTGLLEKYPTEGALRNHIAKMPNSNAALKIGLQKLAKGLFKKSWARRIFGTRNAES